MWLGLTRWTFCFFRSGWYLRLPWVTPVKYRVRPSPAHSHQELKLSQSLTPSAFEDKRGWRGRVHLALAAASLAISQTPRTLFRFGTARKAETMHTPCKSVSWLACMHTHLLFPAKLFVTEHVTQDPQSVLLPGFPRHTGNTSSSSPSPSPSSSSSSSSSLRSSVRHMATASEPRAIALSPMISNPRGGVERGGGEVSNLAAATSCRQAAKAGSGG